MPSADGGQKEVSDLLGLELLTVVPPYEYWDLKPRFFAGAVTTLSHLAISLIQNLGILFKSESPLSQLYKTKLLNIKPC